MEKLHQEETETAEEKTAQQDHPKPTTESKEKEKLSAKELKELLQRTQANFENYRKQIEKRIAEIYETANKKIILQLLPIIDNFELALKNSDDAKRFKEGLEMIYAQLNSLLETNQVQSIETKDKLFDPYQHEALLKVESEQPEGIILEEFQRGFMIRSELLRPAKVKVSAGPKNKPAPQEKSEEEIIIKK